MLFTIDIKKFFKYNLCIIGLLVILHAITLYVVSTLSISENDFLYNIHSLFMLEEEKSIPTFYSIISLFFSSMFLLCIGLNSTINRKEKYKWVSLSGLFVFLACDESAMIHERFHVFSKYFDVSSAWIIPYSIFVCFLILIYWRFFFKLPVLFWYHSNYLLLINNFCNN